MSLVRIFSLDFYMSPPIEDLDVMYSDFRGSCVYQVPIIRIFGSSDKGIKTCLHIHGVFPYIYIPFEGAEYPNSVMYQVASKLDQAINISLGHATSGTQHIYKIVLVSGIPFYGYHDKHHQFLKIFFYNPLIMKKASNLLQYSGVFGKVYQPHEAHIPFTLQFMIDYNLHGMNFISLSQVRYRRTGAESSENTQSDLDSDMFLRKSVPKTSTCSMEMDGLAEHIVNRFELLENEVVKNPGIAALWEDEKQRRRDKNESSQLSPCVTQTRQNVPPTESHRLFRKALKEKLLIKMDKPSPNLSELVYPAETSKLQNLLNASTIEHHSAKTDSYSFTASFDETIADLNDQTIIMNNTFDQNYFGDTDANELLKVLHDLGENVKEEEDSVLTQVSKKGEESEEENDTDLSLPIASTNTPTKMLSDETFTKLENSVLDKTIVNEEGSSHFVNTDATLRETNEQDTNHQFGSSNTPDRVKRKLNFLDIDLLATGSFDQESLKNFSCERKKRNADSSSDDYPLSGVSKSSKSELLEELFINVSNKKKMSNSCSQNPPSIKDSEEIFLNELEMSPTEVVNNTTFLKSEQYDIATKCVVVAGPSKENLDYLQLSSESGTLTPSLRCSGQSAQSELIFSSFEGKDTIFNFTQNLTLLDLTEVTNETNSHRPYKILMPKFNPPSREIIEKSLDENDIPLIRYQEPFYSDSKHGSNDVQVGQNVLKIISKVSDLAEFQCSNKVTLLEERNAIMERLHPDIGSKQKNVKLLFSENTQCFVTTVKLPPTYDEVILWQKKQMSKEKTEKKEVKAKAVVYIPKSPGGQSDSDSCDDSMILSPFSPESVTKSEDSPKTPKSSKNPSSSRKSSKKKNLKFNNSRLRRSLLNSKLLNQLENRNDSYQITGVSLDNTHDFKMSLENLQKAKAISECQYLGIVSMELHIRTRADFKPDPQLDPIGAIFYSIQNDVPESSSQIQKFTGVIAVDPKKNILNGCSVSVTYVDSEQILLEEFDTIMRKYDPDILVGYEIELLSWGYLIERGYVLGINLQSKLGRTLIKINSFSDDEQNLKLTGRILLDVWRLMKHEIALQSYSFESVMYHILHKRIPLYSFRDLTFWWDHGSSLFRHRTVNFYVTKVMGNLELFDQLDLVNRTSELARLFGIQFFEVLSRGSQFRVESMMLRLAKPCNFVAVSPSIQQRAKMKAPEWLPLILEPESKFYVDPVIVLDFQSLYPSMIIAYNYCFSTCLGKVENLGQDVPFVFGAAQLQLSNAKLKSFLRRNLLNFSPCGVAFVKPQVREGILPRMLFEILDTRLMVKRSMKQNKENKLLQRVLHARQLGLKLIANVTYGYTAANFSGRMPLVEVGDSVVSKGRETLLRAIKLIENTPRWGAKVVYGDTDSVFVLVRGKSRECAFKIGEEIADAVTNDNPSPVKLKLEKIFQPCILQTKKRYVGYMYESANQVEPEFCAKGIETVRRDGCPAVSKMLERCLKILFETKDVSLVRKYAERQFTKLLSGKFSLQDLIFAKEYRGADHYRPGACVPALELARKWISSDKRNEPRRGERVPYVIVNGPPGLPLIKLVRSPRELISDSNLHPNVLYYITRAIIPPLNRCLMLIGADVNSWFNAMPKKKMSIISCVSPDSTSKKRAISHYFSTTACISCNVQHTQQGICASCCKLPQETVAILVERIRLWERAHNDVKRICQSCTGRSTDLSCISLDCPVLYCMARTTRDLQQIPYVQHTLNTTLGIKF